MPFGKGSGRTHGPAVAGYGGLDGRRRTDTGADRAAEFRVAVGATTADSRAAPLVRAGAPGRATEASRPVDAGVANGVRLRVGGDHHRLRGGVGDIARHRVVDVVARIGCAAADGAVPTPAVLPLLTGHDAVLRASPSLLSFSATSILSDSLLNPQIFCDRTLVLSQESFDGQGQVW